MYEHEEDGPATKAIKAEVKQALEVAYQKLSFAGSQYEFIDFHSTVKIAAVRKQVFVLLNGEIDL